MAFNVTERQSKDIVRGTTEREFTLDCWRMGISWVQRNVWSPDHGDFVLRVYTMACEEEK